MIEKRGGGGRVDPFNMKVFWKDGRSERGGRKTVKKGVHPFKYWCFL